MILLGRVKPTAVATSAPGHAQAPKSRTYAQAQAYRTVISYLANCPQKRGDSPACRMARPADMHIATRAFAHSATLAAGILAHHEIKICVSQPMGCATTLLFGRLYLSAIRTSSSAIS